MKKFVAFILILSLCATLFACAKQDNEIKDDTASPGEVSDDTDIENPVATIEMEDGGIIKIELYYDVAPNTVLNFVSLANEGFYDGLTLHRVISNFMIQGGDPNGDGTGGPGYCIKGEFSNNNFENNISHKRGVVSMARRGSSYDPASAYNTAGSQFFICVEDSDFLDGDYAAFGEVIEGMDVVDAIKAVETDSNDKPLEDVTIKTITVDTGFAVLPEPETLSE